MAATTYRYPDQIYPILAIPTGNIGKTPKTGQLAPTVFGELFPLRVTPALGVPEIIFPYFVFSENYLSIPMRVYRIYEADPAHVTAMLTSGIYRIRVIRYQLHQGTP